MPSSDKIRVLIVDDILETRDSIKRLLQFDSTIEVAGLASSGREAIEVCQQLKPDVIIMDINMQDMDGITATEAIRKKLPYIQVIILSVQNDANYMRKAMLAGARDFLAKPPTIDELTKAVHQAGKLALEERAKLTYPAGTITGANGQPISMAHPLQHGRIIVVYSPKGGAGTTSIAINLAIALHSDTDKSILVDASLQFGDVPVFLNTQVKNDMLDLTTRVDELESEIVEGVVQKHNVTGVFVLAAPQKPENAAKVNPEAFGKTLQYLQRMYKYVIVDTSSYLNDPVLSAMEVSDMIILITTQDISSIKSCNTFLILADASGIRRDHILFVLNKFDKRISISPERVGENLRQEIVISIPFDDRIAMNAIIRGTPFVIDNKAQPISRGIYQLGDKIKEHFAKLNEKQ